jgi:hypothetical protein
MMNQRIRELALQAGYQEDMFGIGHWDMLECQRFAELIVRECAAVANINSHQWQVPGDFVLQHFGVKQ